MKLSLNWLRDFVDVPASPEELAELLTLRVAEVEGVIRLGAEWGGVSVARVRSVRPHPKGGGLTICEVETGAGEKTVVCGAANVRPGLVAPFAASGSRLPDGRTIRETRIHDIASQGMLCSAAELELDIAGAGDGLFELAEDLTPGRPLAEVRELADVVLEIDNKSITHRPDLWGILGFAREVAALTAQEVRLPENRRLSATARERFPVSVETPELCARYLALALDGVHVTTSPFRLRYRLQTAGLRPLNNVVDLTNYVMAELGQPLHAFDLRRLAGPSIVVRRARPEERLTTLDGIDRILDPTMLVIADAKGAVALAGVMGGDSSKIGPDTQTLVLEAATFDPVNIRKTAAALGLRTDAAARFEKSLDPELPGKAANRFLTLAQGLMPGLRAVSRIEDVRRPDPPAERIRLRLSRVRQLLGVDPGRAKVLEILRRLEFGVEDAGAEGGDVFEVTPPSFRATKDVRIEEDLVEEVGRVFGYANLPGHPPRAEVRPAPQGREQRLERDVKTTLAQAMGFQEVYAYSFVTAEAIGAFGLRTAPHVEVRNPPSQDQSRLRRSLALGLLHALEVNARRFRQQRLFEVGRVWEPETPSRESLPSEHKVVAAVEWQVGRDGTEVLHRLKGGLETLFGQLRTAAPAFDRAPPLPPWLHPGRSARVMVDGIVLGHVGELHPSLAQALRGGVALFELRIDAIGRVRHGIPRFRPIPRFPAVIRDRSWVVGEAVTVAEIESRARQAGGSLIRDLSVFDIYRGASIPSGHKSLSFEIHFGSPDRTLTDQEADEALARMDRAIHELGGVPRS